ncbi:MAG: RimK/LysX family protein [Cellvibrionales bacterium]|nr:RimK/LysX family protein [Cellvibrionales bacterium]
MSVLITIGPIKVLTAWLLMFAASQSLANSNPSKDSAASPLAGKTIVGEAEYLKLIPGNVVVTARVDTGAKVTSIGVTNIQEFERDGERWVSFDLPSTNHKKKKKDKAAENASESIEPPINISRKVVGYALIKQHSGEPIKRYEVNMTLVVGDYEQTIRVNLANRENFVYPTLIGRNYLTGKFLVDPSKKYEQGMPKK